MKIKEIINLVYIDDDRDETRRLDYLGLQIEGKYQVEKDEECKRKPGETLSILLKKRNRMAVTGGIQ